MSKKKTWHTRDEYIRMITEILSKMDDVERLRNIYLHVVVNSLD